MSKVRTTMVAASLLLGACVPSVQSIGLRDVSVEMPGRFDDPTAPDEAALPDRSQVFDDPQLAVLIDEALHNNRELAYRIQEINIANAELIARRGEYLPKVDLFAGAGLEKVGRYTSQGAADRAVEIEEGREVPENLGDLHVGIAATWEVDIWKRLRNESKAARLRYLSSIEGRNLLVTSLVAEVADTYYELLALDAQLAVVQSNVEILQNSLKIVELQKQAAKVTLLAVQRFEAELLKNEARQYELQQQIVETENRLNGLCGRFPQSIVRNAAEFTTLSPMPVVAGAPAAILEHRPDVRAAELELAAEKLEVKAARTLFYPSLGIDAEVGIEAFALRRLTSLPESLLYDVAGGLLAPLLNRNAIKAEYLAANARQMQAVVEYERTVIGAFTEVATQLARQRNYAEAYRRKAEQVAVLERAIDTSNGLFRSARADYLEVLTTRRESLESQLELIETKKEQMSARVDLYRALGGGWRQPEGATDEVR